MKKQLLITMLGVLFLVSCKTPPEPNSETIAQGATNIGDTWVVYLNEIDDVTNQLVYTISSKNYLYLFSIVAQTHNGDRIYTFALFEQTGRGYKNDYWDTYQIEIDGEITQLENTTQVVLEDGQGAMVVTGMLHRIDIQSMAGAQLVNIIASSSIDEQRTIINTLPIEFQESLLTL